MGFHPYFWLFIVARAPGYCRCQCSLGLSARTTEASKRKIECHCQSTTLPSGRPTVDISREMDNVIGLSVVGKRIISDKGEKDVSLTSLFQYRGQRYLPHRLHQR